MKKKWIKRLLFVGCLAALCAGMWLHSRHVWSTRSGLGKNFELDMSSYMTVDPALLLYDELPSIPLDIESPFAFALGPIFSSLSVKKNVVMILRVLTVT